MESNKVKLPKEVAEAIETFWDKFGSNDKLFNKHIALTNWNNIKNNAPQTQYMTLIKYASVNPIEYMQALVNGYEVEQTPEDKVREYYRDQLELARLDPSKADYSSVAVCETLNILNIKIKGVNDHESN